MTLTIDLTPDQEARLQALAQQRGLPPPERARRILEERLALEDALLRRIAGALGKRVVVDFVPADRGAAPHPGEVLRRIYLDPLGLTAETVAARLHVAPAELREVLDSRRGITPELAARLGRLFATSDSFWLGLQREHDLAQVHERLADELLEIEPLTREEFRGTVHAVP